MKIRRLPGGIIRTKCDREGHVWGHHEVEFDFRTSQRVVLKICERCGYRKIERKDPSYYG